MVSIVDTLEEMDACMERMISLQTSAYPDSWTADEKREMAIAHLFPTLTAERTS